MTLLILLFLLTGIANAQFIEGSTIARAGVVDLGYRGSSALNFNPAILGPNSRAAMTSIDLLSVNATAVNNAFSINFWNDQIARDHYLTTSDKEEILDRMNGDEFSIHANASAPLGGVTYRKMGASVSFESAVMARAPREIFELALYGNQLDKSYALNDFDGEEYTILNVAVGFAYEFKQDWVRSIHGGVTFHFYQGLSYEKIENASGELLVTDSLITGYTVIQRLHSERGDGVGFDLGGLAEIDDRWRVGLAMRQIGSRITWDVDENEIQVWESDSAGIIVDSLDDDDYLERAFASEDTTYTGGSTDSDLPLLIEFAGRYEATMDLSLMSSLLLRTMNSAQGKRGVEAGIAGEYRARRWLPLSAGFGVGGSSGVRVGIGGGLRFENYELSVGWSWNRGLFSSARGISFGLSQQIRF